MSYGMKLLAGEESIVLPERCLYPGGVPLLRPQPGATISYLTDNGKVKYGVVLTSDRDVMDLCPGVGSLKGGMIISVAPGVQYSIHRPSSFVFERDELAAWKAWLMHVLCFSVAKSALRVGVYDTVYHSVCEEMHMYRDYETREALRATSSDGQDTPESVWRWR